MLVIDKERQVLNLSCIRQLEKFLKDVGKLFAIKINQFKFSDR